ncbi:MAG TPA: Crp/Fnr family transcriptional regulator [Thermotogota bacterium]|nr:Crp/Fnr family transcriptional regulator [Thermotogota bacterium]HRW34980.1 Crp/Fnr family transcriptional regulator [Thermotogota bacterium]
MNPLIVSLSKSQLFQGVTISELEQISKNTTISITKFKSEEIIRSCDEEANSMFLILEGLVKGMMEDIEGHVYQVEEFSPSELTAPANLFSEEEYFPVSLIAKTDCQLIEIDKSTLLTMFRFSGRMEENFLRILSNKVLFLANKLWENQFYSISQKIYQLVYKVYKERNESVFDMDATHEELAQRFGVSRPSFSRALIKINREGIIKCSAKCVEILSREALADKIYQMN